MTVKKIPCIALFALCATLWQFTGCMEIKAFPAEFTQVATDLSAMVRDQGVIDKFSTGIDGNVQNPGIESYINVRTSAGVRFVGVNGEVELETGGEGTRLPDGLRQSLIDRLDGDISDEERESILKMLGWNRPRAAGG